MFDKPKKIENNSYVIIRDAASIASLGCAPILCAHGAYCRFVTLVMLEFLLHRTNNSILAANRQNKT